MANGDVAQVAIRYRQHNQTMVNVLHFRENGSSTNLDELLELFAAGGTASPISRLILCLNGQCRIQDLRAVYVKGGAPIEANRSVDQVGAITAPEPVPNTVSTLCSLRSAQIGRSARGRVFLPAPTGQQIDDVSGLWTVAFRLTVSGFIQAMQNTFTFPSEWVHVIWSPTRFAIEGNGYIPPNVSTWLIDPVPRNQRRRAIQLFGS